MFKPVSAELDLVSLEARVRAFWKDHDVFHESVRRTHDQAEMIAAEVNAIFRTGEVDFCDLASRFSDDAESRFQCGLIGVVEPAMLPRPLEDELFALAPGDVSEVVETEFGFHLIKRDEP